MVNMKSMKMRVQSLVETDDDLYGVVICNLLGLGLYGEVAHGDGDKVLLLHSDLGPEPEQLQSMVESLQAQARAGAGAGKATQTQTGDQRPGAESEQRDLLTLLCVCQKCRGN